MSSSDDSSQFQWAETTASPITGPRRSRRTKIHYNAFSNGSLTVKRNDHVMISNFDAEDAEAPEQCFIAKITALYDRGDESDSCHRATVQWYSRINDLHRLFPSKFQTSHKWEVVRDNRKSFDTDVDAETIFGLCQVIVLCPQDVIPNNQNHQNPTFFVRWTFNGHLITPANQEKPIESKSAALARRCLFDGNDNDNIVNERLTQTQPIGTKSPFKSFYSGSPRTSRADGRLRRVVPRALNWDKSNGIEPRKRKSCPVKFVSDSDEEISIGKRRHESSRNGVKDEKVVKRVKRRVFGDEEEEEEDDEITFKVETGKESREDEVEMISDESSDEEVKIRPVKRRIGEKRNGKVVRKLGFSKREDELTEVTNMLEKARTCLHVSVIPENLPCRENEFQTILSFVKGKLIDGSSGCMYISGVPGTGKTATVFEVMRCLRNAKRDSEVPGFQFVEINGMKLTAPHQAYVQIVKELTDQKMTAECAVQMLTKRFKKPAPRREHVVLLVDELDLLLTRRQDVLYNLFDWPAHARSRLIVLAIANTMNLPERVMMTRVVSRIGMTRLTFQPYTHKQLQQIILARISDLDAFDADAVQLVAKKVAAVSGDARRALDICRRATEITEHSFTSPKKGKQDGRVGVMQVDAALNEMFTSPKILAMRNASVYEQFFLKAIAEEVERTGLEETTLSKIFKALARLCREEGMVLPNETEVSAICAKLATCRLLIVEDGYKDCHRNVRLNVGTDDVYFALR